MAVKSKPNSPLSLRLEPSLTKRLEECADRTRIKKYTLAILAIEAAVDAIERNGYRLVVPIQFDVAQVPVEAPKNSSSSTSTKEGISGRDNQQGPAGPAKKPKAA